MRVELVGGLGIGKSTLCQALAEIGFNCIYEDLGTNPFLADCFINPAAFRFPSQMWFVLSKYHEIRKYEDPAVVNVLDQAVLNVRAYTNLLFQNEDPAALRIINDCFSYMEAQTGAPDLLINLKCSPAVQLERIRGRNRDHEKAVTLDYVTALQDEIDQLIAAARAEGQAVLNIDTEQIYLPGNIDFARRLARQVGDLFHVDMKALLASRGQACDTPPVLDYIRIVERA